MGIIAGDAVDQLRAYFDTVQIFCTKHNPEEDTTIYVDRGSGNVFARIEQASSWSEYQRNGFGQILPPPSDDGEDEE